MPPIMVKTAKNPGGLPIEVFDGFRAALAPTARSSTAMSRWPFYGFNRPGAKISQGVIGTIGGARA